MNRRAFAIPTKDRPECVEYYLKTQGKALACAGFDIIISDSSADDATKDIVTCYKTDGLDIVYDTYHEKGNATSIDEKGFTLCKKYCGQYDYIWLCSDGTVIDVARAIQSIEQDMTRGKDMIILSDANVLPYSDREFYDAVTLCRELCWRMLLLGSVIVSGTLLQKTVAQYPYQQADYETIWLPAAYFKMLSLEPVCAVYHCVNGVFCINPYKKGSFWYLAGNTLWQWGKVWCNTIDSLPVCFDAVKKEVLLSHDRYMKVFSVRNLPRLKISGNLTFRKLLQYRKYLKRVTNTPFIFFIIIQVFFPTNMRFINLLKRFKKRFFARNG